MAKYVHNLSLKEISLLRFQLFDFLFCEFELFLKVFYGSILPFFHKSETTITKQLFLNLIFCFLLVVLFCCLETGVNIVANCVTQKFTPLRSEFYKRIFDVLLWTI